MFHFLKRSPKPAPDPSLSRDQVIAVANAIAAQFAKMVASGQVLPGLVYDVSMLPHSKSVIKNACVVTIRYASREQREGWKIVLPILSQFQEGVGGSPLGLDPAAILAGGGVDEMIRRVANMKKLPPEIETKVEAEFRELLQWVCREVDNR
ncbi:MAG: hypothetical protein NTW19_00680 [Planctomycetota bacterium]|nr:hypothetical protein [Planctomycetota bacterium]